MTDPVVQLDATRNGVAMVTLNRPAFQNAVNNELIDGLIEVTEELKGADGVRVVILEGAGQSFCAGLDADWLRYVADHTFDDHIAEARDMRHALTAFQALPQVTLALVRGAANGFGAALALAADITLADRSAVFSFPEARMGMSSAILLPLLVEAVGPKAARRYVLTCEPIDAETALRTGLVQALADDQTGLSALCESIVDAIFRGAPATLASTKLVLDAIRRDPGAPQLAGDLVRHHAEALAATEGQEGLAAILAGRKPSWTEE